MAYEYLLTTLPPLPDEPGSALPISAETLWERVKLEGEGVSEFTEFLLRVLDVQNLAFIDSNRESAIRKAVVPLDGLKDQKDLPHWMKQALVSVNDKDRPYRFDRLWEAYFEQLMGFLEEQGAETLLEWFRWEIGLRNAIVSHRARKMGISPDPYYVAPDLGLKPIEYNAVFTELKEIDTEGDPFAEDRFIAKEMLRKLQAATPEYAFDFTEIMGYVIKFLILARTAYLRKQGD